MPRKQKYKPQDNNTLNTRYNNNPYFYKKNDSQNNNNLKYNTFIRDLCLEYRNLQKENLELKDQLTLKIKAVEKLKVENELQKDTIDLLNKENEKRNKDKCLKKNLIKENFTLKADNEKLKEQIKIYSNAIVLYQSKMAMKISGQVEPEFDTYFLNFT
ncbi:hypothetical protein C1645_824703 [Glomus cerebriforme]|uniref:Uncharacterized protein n=1 Tax=Glomus cerebriforme TaxID=658196 RepID=A0A397SX43_9GLOM|nr:hypothetical protein C1645_824703 [Glomus cerebriforme]